jgi:hypothetical protein
MNALSRWLKYAAPAPFPAALVSAAGGFFVLGLLAAIGYGLSNPAGSFGENAGFLFGTLITPFITLLLVIAAFVEKSPFPRAWLWACAAGMVLFGGLWLALGLASSSRAELGLGVGLFSYCVFCAPPALACFAPSVYFAAKAAPGVRAMMSSDAERRVAELITLRGETSLADLAATTGLTVPELQTVVARVLQTRQAAGLLDSASGRVYSAQSLLDKQRKLALVITARGQIRLDELAQELNAPRDLLRDWIYQLVRRGEFTGYMNWNEGLIYSAEAKKLSAAGRCPRCGGDLALAGKGVIRCEHCGSEIFL